MFLAESNYADHGASLVPGTWRIAERYRCRAHIFFPCGERIKKTVKSNFFLSSADILAIIFSTICRGTLDGKLVVGDYLQT